MFEGFQEWWNRLWNLEPDEQRTITKLSPKGIQFLARAKKDYATRHPTTPKSKNTGPKRAAK